MSTARFQVSPPLSEAVRTRRQLTTKALAFVEAQGYAEIEVPLLAPYDELQAALGPEVSARLFRFIDRDGTLLVLRGDLTPLVARQLASVAATRSGPLRVAYADRVARVRRAFAREQVESNELGVELVGVREDAADIEVIRLMLSVLTELGVDDMELTLGDVRIAGGLIEATELPVSDRRTLERAIARRDPYAVEMLCGQAQVRPELTRALEQTCALSPTLDDLDRLAAGAPDATRAGIDALRGLISSLEGRGAAPVAPDLGVLDDRGYYTGARFAVRSSRAASPLARGGRYDRLFGHFGPHRAAVGVGFDLDTLVAIQGGPS